MSYAKALLAPFVLAVLAGCPSSPPEAEPTMRSAVAVGSSPNIGRRYALVVGTNEYDRSRGWPPLTFAVNDAELIAKELEKFGYEILKVPGPNPSLDEFDRALLHAKEVVGPDDDLLVFVAGHGHYDSAVAQGYLIFRDSPPAERCRTGGCYPLSSIRTALDTAKARHVLVIIDVCYGGTFLEIVAVNDRSRAVSVKAAKSDYSRLGSRLVLTSGGNTQVPDKSEFAASILRTLRQPPEHGIVTFEALVAAVRGPGRADPRYGSFGVSSSHQPGGTYLLIRDDLVPSPEQEALDAALTLAKSTDSNPSAPPGAKAEAWEAVARLTVRGQNPHAQSAKSSAASWRAVESRQRAMRAEWHRLERELDRGDQALAAKLGSLRKFLGDYADMVAERDYQQAKSVAKGLELASSSADQVTGDTRKQGKEAELARMAEEAQPPSRKEAKDAGSGSSPKHPPAETDAGKSGEELNRMAHEASTKDPAAALKLFEQAAAKGFLPAYKHVAFLKSARRDFPGAVEAYKRYLDSDPKDADSVRDIIEQITRSGGGGTGRAPKGFVEIPAGVFTMGSPSSEEERDSDETQREVRITRAFWLQSTEVTQAQWESVMGSKPSYFSSCGSSCPVVQVSWEDAIQYLNKLSEREGLERCYGSDGSFKGLRCTGYRLPTEAEWEYAARAGTTGSRYGSLDGVAWYSANSGEKTQPVGKKSPNAWGIYDMLGNVWEWVQDWYGPNGGNASDPMGPSTGEYRVLRGGGWNSFARYVRAAHRFGFSPGNRLYALGFRAARSIP